MEKFSTRKEQARNTKQKLITTAIRLFKQYGYEKVTIEQICKETNVTTGAFYHHLKNKAGVILEGYAEYDDYFDKILKDCVDNDKDNISKILDCIEYQCNFCKKLGVEAICEVYKIQITENNNFFLDTNRSIFKTINKLVLDAQNENVLNNEISSEEITKELLIVSRGVVYNWCQHNGNFDIYECSKKIIKNYISAYMK